MAAAPPAGDATEADRESMRRLFGGFAAAPAMGTKKATPPPSKAADAGAKGKRGGGKLSGLSLRAGGSHDAGSRERNHAAAKRSEGEAKGNAAAAHGSQASAAASPDDKPGRTRYTREALLQLRSSPLVGPPPGCAFDKVLSKTRPNGGVQARGQRGNNAFQIGFRESGQPHGSRALGRGRGAPATGKGSAALMPFGDGVLGDKAPPGLAAPHVKLSDRVKDLRTNPGGQRSPQSVRRMERMDPREARGGPRDPNWGRGGAPQHHRDRQPPRGRHEQGGRERGRRQEEEESLPEWANETFDRDDMMILGGFDDIDDSNLPDFFKKTPSTKASEDALEGSLEPLEERKPRAPVTEEGFFGDSSNAMDGADSEEVHNSKFSRFFGSGSGEGPSEADIPQAPWSTDPVEAPPSTEPEAPTRNEAVCVDRSHADKSSAGLPGAPPVVTKPAAELVSAEEMQTADPSVEKDRAALMRLFGGPAATGMFSGDGGGGNAQAPPADSGGQSVRAEAPRSVPTPAQARSVEEDRSNLMKLFGGGVAEGPPGLGSTAAGANHAPAPVLLSVQAAPAVDARKPAAPFYDDGEDDDALGETIVSPSTIPQTAVQTNPNEAFREALFAMMNKDPGAQEEAPIAAPGVGGVVPAVVAAPLDNFQHASPEPMVSTTIVPKKEKAKVTVERSFMPTSVIRKMGKGRGRGRGRSNGRQSGKPMGQGAQQTATLSQEGGSASMGATPAAGVEALSASQANIMRLFPGFTGYQ